MPGRARPSRGPRAGFTLVEVLVALTITGIILAGVYAAVQAAVDAEERQREVREDARRERHARLVLAALLRSAEPVGFRDSVGLTGVDAAESPSGEDELLLRTSLGFAFAGFPRDEPLRVRVWVEPERRGERGALLLELRRVRARDGPADTLELLAGVSRMEASYRGADGAWRNSWHDRANLPRTVRLVFERARRPLPDLLVALPAGRGI